MSEEKFTEGPWFYEAATGEIYSDNYAEIICDMLPTGFEEFDANAALVAAAPEMYEMLKECSEILNNEGRYVKHISIEKLLAKARGEQ